MASKGLFRKLTLQGQECQETVQLEEVWKCLIRRRLLLRQCSIRYWIKPHGLAGKNPRYLVTLPEMGSGAAGPSGSRAEPWPFFRLYQERPGASREGVQSTTPLDPAKGSREGALRAGPLYQPPKRLTLRGYPSAGFYNSLVWSSDSVVRYEQSSSSYTFRQICS